MTKTDADWQALDARIAQEVMGWFKWDELPEILRIVFWKAIEEESPDEYDLAYNRSLWWSVDESGCPDSEESIQDWQPHKNVAQALRAADKICDQGWDRELTRLGAAQTRYASFWRYHAEDHPADYGCTDTDAKAICLAVEAWLDAKGGQHE